MIEGNKTPIGLAQIWSYNEYIKSLEIGFAILPDYGGQGYGSETAKLLLQLAFENFEKLDTHEIVGKCDSRNRSSAALMERIGMTREAIFR